MDARTDLLIVGGGTGGCAAALAAARCGLRVILTEETAWVGGQFTSQGVPPDEHGWIEELGCTRSYKYFRDQIRTYYRQHYPLSTSARASRHLNPGSGWVSPLCHEPKVSHAVLRAMMSPWEASGRLTVWTHTTPLSADVDGDLVRGLRFVREGRAAHVEARWVLDATELGDLCALAGVEHVTGAEAQSDTQEPSAPATSQPANVQAFSWCFAMEYFDGEDHRIAKPDRYDYWRDYIPALHPPWPGKLLSWTTPNPRTMAPHAYHFHPVTEEPVAFSGLWSYRRLLHREQFEDGFLPSDVCLVNWPLIDYLDGELCTATEDARQRYLLEARELSQCVFYWLQHDAPRPDGGAGWPGLRLAGNALGTADGFAMAPYIRESRRIRARKTITEQEVSAACRPGHSFAVSYPDSVGIGSYRIDLHPSTGGDNYIDVPALPFQIPFGALVPLRVRNLLPAAKNMGTTHITNGCYRLHPVEWNIGEAAALAIVCCEQWKEEPHGLERRMADFQKVLVEQGIELAWPAGLDLNAGDAHRHAQPVTV